MREWVKRRLRDRDAAFGTGWVSSLFFCVVAQLSIRVNSILLPVVLVVVLGFCIYAASIARELDRIEDRKD